MRVLRLKTEDAERSRVGDGEIVVSDTVDQRTVPDAWMTVGFAHESRLASSLHGPGRC